MNGTGERNCLIEQILYVCVWADTVSGPLPRNEVENSHSAEGLKISNAPLFDHSVAGETNCQHIIDTLIDYNCIYLSGQVTILGMISTLFQLTFLFSHNSLSQGWHALLELF